MRIGNDVVVTLSFKPQHLWVGVYWESYMEGPWGARDIWICIVPMFPLNITIWHR